MEGGEVYACCHEKPKVLGNIYKDTLENIYNNDAFQEARRKSLEGKLSCYRFCNLLHPEEFKDQFDTTTSDYSNLKRLKIQFGQDCNIHCVMCYQNKNKRGNKSIDADILKKNINLEPFEVIDIQGGEPMFIPSARDYYDYAAEKGKKLSFLTNGTIMTKEWAKRLALHSPFFHVSLNAATKEMHEKINAGSSWERVLKNIALIRDVGKEEQSDIKIKGHFTIIMKNCHEIPDFIEIYKSIGIDKIDFGYDFRFPFYLFFRPLFKRKLIRRISAAINKAEDLPSIDYMRLSHIKLIDKKTRRKINSAFPSSTL